MSDLNNELPMWTIYDHPADYQELFVARKWIADKNGPTATEEVVIGATLELVRSRMQDFKLTPIARDPNDDPKIVETWI